MSVINVGILGGGFSAQTFHAPFITTNPSYSLRAFLRTSQTPVKGYESIPVYTNADLFLSKDLGLDLVVITSPTFGHFDHTLLALEANKDVIVEKPFTVSEEEAKILTELAAKKNRILAVYQNRRWDGDFLTVQSLFEKGTLGKVVSFESHFDRFRPFPKPNSPWREVALKGSGVLYDLGSHLIDQSLVLFGVPKSVTGHLLYDRNMTTDDGFIITLNYPNNLIVILRSSSISKKPGSRFTINGTKGTFIKDGLDVQENQLKSGKTPLDKSFAEEDESSFGTLWLDTEGGGEKEEKLPTLKGSYVTFFENVADSILHRDPNRLLVKPEQAAMTIKLIQLTIQSFVEGKTIAL